MYKKILLIIFVVLFCIGWTSNPKVNTQVSLYGGGDPGKMAPDGAGGVVIAWDASTVTDHSDIFVQRLDASGKALWGSADGNGVHVCTSAYDQINPEIASDGSGGAIIAWNDHRGGGYSHHRIYVQRVAANGTVQWTTDGIAISLENADAGDHKLIPDGSGGAFITWENSFTSSEIHVQRIDSAGEIQWTPGGIVVSTQDTSAYEPNLIPSGSNSAIIAWKHVSSGYSAIFARKINAAGVLSWAAEGVQISADDRRSLDYSMVSDGSGGAIFSWFERGDAGDGSIYSQRVDRFGAVKWAVGGVPICVTPDHQHLHQMTANGSGGAIIAWTSHPGDYREDIFAQKIGPDGTVKWTTNGVPVCTEDGGQRRPELVQDGSGGAIIVWEDYRSDTHGDIYAQRIGVSGERKWRTGGAAISTRDVTKMHPQVISDGSGGAIITWDDWGGNYAQNVCNNGDIGNCSSPVAVIEAGRFGGFVPLTIHFDGSGSFDPNGKVVGWDWDLGDGSTSSKETLSHTYDNPGKYFIELRVRNNQGKWSPEARKLVIAYSPGDLEKVEISLNPSAVKAYGKGLTQVGTICYEKQTDPGHEERAIPVDLGVDFSVTSGEWVDEVAFDTGVYSRSLFSGDPGTAAVSAVLDGEVLGTAQVEFTWPKPPVNVSVDIKENRSLFRGQYYAHLSWSANPDEVYTPANYRVYRAVDGGVFELIAEVGAGVFTYADEALPGGGSYSFAISMVDAAGDESDLSTTVSGAKR